MNVGHLPDDTRINSLGDGIVCTQCGHLGADVVPNWPTHAHRAYPDAKTMSLHDAAAEQAILDFWQARLPTQAGEKLIEPARNLLEEGKSCGGWGHN
jgi:hypothetical protein